MTNETYLDLQSMSEAELYKFIPQRLKGLPRPVYPFPDITPPYFDRLREEYRKWIDEDFTFHSVEAREKHKRHTFTDINARSFPTLSYEKQFPISRYSGTFAMFDDFVGHATQDEINAMRERIWGIFTGKEEIEPRDHGIYHQSYLIRAESLEFGMHEQLFLKFASSMDELIRGYQREKEYTQANTPPSFEQYTPIRDITAGAIPYGKYACAQENYCLLPDDVLEHPHILRLHLLLGRLVGYHNDVVSLPKELSRKGDVINFIIVFMHEHKLCLEDAYMMAMEVHDKTLQEYIGLMENLPDFGQWQDLASGYAKTFGTILQGIWTWHVRGDNDRYTSGWIVDPEFRSKEWKWKD